MHYKQYSISETKHIYSINLDRYFLVYDNNNLFFPEFGEIDIPNEHIIKYIRVDTSVPTRGLIHRSTYFKTFAS